MYLKHRPIKDRFIGLWLEINELQENRSYFGKSRRNGEVFALYTEKSHSSYIIFIYISNNKIKVMNSARNKKKALGLSENLQYQCTSRFCTFVQPCLVHYCILSLTSTDEYLLTIRYIILYVLSILRVLSLRNSFSISV